MNLCDSSGVKFIPSLKKKKKKKPMKEQEDDEPSFPGKLLNLWLHFGKMILSCSPKYLLNNLWAQQGQSCEVMCL